MTTNWQPHWTTQVKIEGGGRYPLGLNRFHDGLEEILIKGIVQQANRLRYVSYCCWVIGDIERTENCSDYAEFVEAFTRRENALAVGFYLLKPQHALYGSSALSKIVKENAKECDCSFRLMQSNQLGAYGLYYTGTIYNWGLTESDERGITRLTEAGNELYRIMEEHYRQEKPGYYVKSRGKRKVPAKQLLEWARVNTFENIRESHHKEEREFYKSVIFRLGKTNVTDYRRDTFAFVMDCIDRCSKNKTVFNEDVLRNIHYYSCFNDSNNKVQKFSVPKYFRDVHFYWFVYEGHVYFRGWLSLYFEFFLEHLKSCDNGSTIDEFFAEIDPTEFNATIKAFCGKRKDYFSSTMKSVLALFPSSPSLSDASSEEEITHRDGDASLSGVLAGFLLVMVGLYTKYKGLRSDKRYQFLVVNLETDLWFETLFRFST